LRTKILIQGNIIESRALYIAQLIVHNMGLKENQFKNNEQEIFQIPLGASYLRVKSMRKNDKNSIIKNYYQVGKATIRNECMTEFLVSVINEPLFDTLRTHEQLGYGVSCSLRKNCGVLSITITVEYQENKNSAEIIDQKIEEFLQKFHLVLKYIKDEEFASVKKSIVSLKLIPDTDLEKEVSRHWEEIRNGEEIFNRNELEAFETEKLTKDEIIEFYNSIFLSEENSRKLSVQVIGDESSSEIEKLIDEKKLSDRFIKDMKMFKDQLKIIK
jgi:nardilysin